MWIVYFGDLNSTPCSGELVQTQPIHLVSASLFTCLLTWLCNPRNRRGCKDLLIYNSIAMESSCGTSSFTYYTSGFNDRLDCNSFEKFEIMNDQVCKCLWQTVWLLMKLFYKVIPLPGIEMTDHIALPSIVLSSDHIALVHDLKWI